MGSNKNNQIRNKMIKRHAITDVQKLAGLERFIHKQYPEIEVTLQPYLLFTKGEDEYVCWWESLTHAQVEMYLVVKGDIMLSFPDKPDLIFELDGPIHDTKRTEKTIRRDTLYKTNELPYLVISESALAEKFNVKDVKKLTQDQINKEFKERFDAL